jgi:hypothetical protein
MQKSFYYWADERQGLLFKVMMRAADEFHLAYQKTGPP